MSGIPDDDAVDALLQCEPEADFRARHAAGRELMLPTGLTKRLANHALPQDVTEVPRATPPTGPSSSFATRRSAQPTALTIRSNQISPHPVTDSPRNSDPLPLFLLGL